jgi:uncharacterized membrane protein YkvA (DUF1232 family)
MYWWPWLVAGSALVALAAALVALSARSFKLPAPARRVLALPWRRKLALVGLLLKDGRVPVWVKIALPALIVYLALPVDLIPDFIPVIGHLDDLLLVALAAAVLLRGIPSEVMEEHIGSLECGGEQRGR